MKRYIPLLALLLASLLYPQSKMDINNLIDRGGLLYAPNKEKPFSGSVFDLYDNGQKKLNGRYRNGIKNGKWQWWNMDGGIDSTGSYKKGLMNGLWEFYFSNGNLKGKGQYRNGNGAERDDTSIARDGRHGKWTFWYESGVLKEKQNWKNGKVYGLNTVWYENGQKWSEGTYKDGKLDGKWTVWYDNGQKMEEGKYKNGKKYQERIYYTKNGSKIEKVCITTEFGVMILEFYPDVAPKHVESFIEHVKNGFYNGTIFHRVIPGFVIQGGDPYSKDIDRSNDGQGGHSAIYFGLGDENINTTWTIPSEFNEHPHVIGALSMARAQDPNSAGSQFFICAGPVHQLDNKYTVFGQVISGLEVIKKIANAPRDNRDNPKNRIGMIIDYCEENMELNGEKSFFPSRLRISAEEYFTSAEIEREAKNIKFSLENLNNLIQHYPDHSLSPQAQYLMGDIYMNDLRDFQNAIISYNKVLTNFSDSAHAAQAQFMVGYIYSNILSDYQKAVETYLIFLEKFPDHELAPSVKFELELLGKKHK